MADHKCHNCGTIIAVEGDPSYQAFHPGHAGLRRCDCGALILLEEQTIDVPDFKLDALVFDQRYRDLRVIAPLAAPAAAFVRNIDRLLSHQYLPQWLTYVCEEHARLARQVASEVIQSRKRAAAGADELGQKIRQIVARRMSGAHDELPKQTDARLPNELEQQLQLCTVPVAPIQALLRWRANAPARLAIRSMLASMVIDAHAAVQILSEQLWVAAVNARPDSLGRNVFSAEHVIDMTTLRALGLSVGHRLGDVAILQDPAAFRDLAATEDAYGQAFRAAPGEAGAQVGELFGQYRERLKLVELLAIVLTRRGGTMDETLIGAAGAIDSRLATLKASTLLPLDGESVASWIGPVIDFSVKLSAFVDGWLRRHAD